MKRLILDNLHHWLGKKNRKSLILKGSRQVGKTWSVRAFAKEAGLDLVEVNFEREGRLKALFEQDLNPKTIVTNLELGLDRRIDKSRALIFLDEVQDCPKALTALKHFTDSEPQLPVIAAGSYLGLYEGKTEGISQPVGYVDELTVFPMSFEEFLIAANSHPTLLEGYLMGTPGGPLVHDALISLYRDHLFVGGMPEVVHLWFETKSSSDSLLAQIHAVRETQKNLISKYKADFAKYHPRDAFNIARTWEVVAEQLSKSFSEVSRFRFRSQIPGKRDYKSFEHYFARLEACGLIHRSFVIEEPRYPLKAQKKESIFKCYFGDTGLLLAEMDVSYQALASSADITYKGPLAENFVCNNLVRLGFPLFAYVRPRAASEIEFLIQHHAQVIPIEVKNNHTTAKSLRWYLNEYRPSYGIKFSSKLGGMTEETKHYPIYLCGQVLKSLLQ